MHSCKESYRLSTGNTTTPLGAVLIAPLTAIHHIHPNKDDNPAPCPQPLAELQSPAPDLLSLQEDTEAPCQGSHPPSCLFRAAQSHQAQVPALYASGDTVTMSKPATMPQPSMAEKPKR